MSEEIVDAEIVEEQTPQGPLKVVVIGDNLLAETTFHAFNVPRGVENYMFSVDQIDEAIELAPSLVFWCEEIPIKKNDSMDDSDFLSGVQKLLRNSPAGLCVRSTISIELFERMMMSMGQEMFNRRVTYMPELSEGKDVASLLSSPYQLIGGDSETLQMHMNLLQQTSWFSANEVRTGTVPEVIYAKLAMSGFRLVQQRYFDEIFDAVLDMKNANPMVVSRLINASVVPSHVSGVQLYDARIFSGATDKLTLLESCLGD